MEMYKTVFYMLLDGDLGIDAIKHLIRERFEKYYVYPDSINYLSGSFFYIALVDSVKKLVICNEGDYYNRFTGTEIYLEKGKIKLCDLTNENSVMIRRIFPFTAPSSHKGVDTTIGMGDRLGLASAGQLRRIKDVNVFPVLAQQSIRELNFTGRTYGDVLAAATWAVFQEGYTSGFGADGDHLKTAAEVRMAIESGFTMVTLDCSEHIDNKIPSLAPREIDKLYDRLDERERKHLEAKYLEKIFKLKSDYAVSFSYYDFKSIVLTYLEAVKYTIYIYNDVIKNCGRNIDFEMSIDETLTSTSPESHFFVASELLDGGVKITSLAPRFCGEFQKGIEYKGDIQDFTREFSIHVQIADYFGYKISVHSGSDKFSVFPIVRKITGGKYHLKTAGTHWLEAIRVIARKKPRLYRRIFEYAMSNLGEAKKFYYTTENTANIPDISGLDDIELPYMIDQPDSRQVLHITYGLILQAKKPDGSYKFRDEIYAVLHEFEVDHYNGLGKHLGRHLDELGIKTS